MMMAKKRRKKRGAAVLDNHEDLILPQKEQESWKSGAEADKDFLLAFIFSSIDYNGDAQLDYLELNSVSSNPLLNRFAYFLILIMEKKSSSFHFIRISCPHTHTC